MQIFNNHIVSIKEFNNVLSQLSKNKSAKSIEITFQNPIFKIDIVFIAGLILYNKKRSGNISFKIYYEYKNDVDDKNRLYEIRQYLEGYTYIYGEDWRNIITEFKDKSTLKKKLSNEQKQKNVSDLNFTLNPQLPRNP